jgi:cellulose synthase/poly-beta-1,6-N-acetylglucosamine synthase-like glycosyltransferase
MTSPTLAETLLTTSLAALVYTFLGYPALIFLLSRLRGASVAKAPLATCPAVSVVLAAHNEESRIAARLANLLASDYPPDKLELVLVSDGSTDATLANAKAVADLRVRVIESPQHVGKAACLNLGVAAATGEIIVFADARQRYTPGTIRELLHSFSDPRVGAVSGNHTTDPAASNVGRGVDLYWQLEKFIRDCEGRFDSSVGCSGAVYAIRRALFQPLAEDTILDDVIIPMQIAAQGHRVVFDPEAQSFDPQQNEPERERIRKRRTLAGNFQLLFRYAGWLLPWRHRLWWQLLSHKYLRLAAPFFLVLAFVSNGWLLYSLAGRLFFATQCACYALALFGLCFPTVRLRLFSIPAGFVFLNLMTLAGLWHFLRGEHRRGWQTVKH